jgi:hypothetical protein
MGSGSVLDFACTAEAAIDSCPTTEDERNRRATEAETKRIATAAEESRQAKEAEKKRLLIRGILNVATNEPWVHEVSEKDPRFAAILPLGKGTIFERIEALSSATASFEDEAALATAITSVKETVGHITSLPLENALREYLAALSRSRGVRLEALSTRLGWGGRPAVTLEKAAKSLGVTRERLRQIQARVLERMPDHPVVMPALDRALDALRMNAPLAAQAAETLLMKQGIAQRPFHPRSIFDASKLCGRIPTFEIARVDERELVVTNALQSVANSIIQTAHIQAGASGVSNVLEVTEECDQNGTMVTEGDVRNVLAGLSDVKFLVNGWFWRPGGIPERNRLRNLTRKMLSVSSPINVTSLREGVRREYTLRRTRGTRRWRLVVPPRDVLEAFYRANPEFRVDEGGLVSSIEFLDYREELAKTERILVIALRSSPTCLLDRATFMEACVDRGMNENTFSIYSTYSPIIEHLGVDLWTLRGVHVDPAAVEMIRESNATRPRQKRIVDHGWTPLMGHYGWQCDYHPRFKALYLVFPQQYGTLSELAIL